MVYFRPDDENMMVEAEHFSEDSTVALRLAVTEALKMAAEELADGRMKAPTHFSVQRMRGEDFGYFWRVAIGHDVGYQMTSWFSEPDEIREFIKRGVDHIVDEIDSGWDEDWDDQDSD